MKHRNRNSNYALPILTAAVLATACNDGALGRTTGATRTPSRESASSAGSGAEARPPAGALAVPRETATPAAHGAQTEPSHAAEPTQPHQPSSDAPAVPANRPPS